MYCKNNNFVCFYPFYFILLFTKIICNDKITTTYTYIDDTEVYYKRAPYDWIKRTLKFDKFVEGESALKSKQGKKTFVSCGKSGEDVNGLSGI
jgi:hypothetical protein